MAERHEEPAVAIAAPRHACTGCGACCFGHRIRFGSDEEQARIVGHGAALGIADPIVDGALRLEHGRCVFLSEALRCRIHETSGADDKPEVCRQYPIRSVRADGVRRIGIDPGCASGFRSWAEGPVVEADRTLGTTRDLSPPEQGAEGALLRAMAAPDTDVLALLHLLAGSRGRDGLPDGYGARLATKLRAMRLGPLLASDELGDGIRRYLAHLPPVFDALDPASPPPFSLAPEADRFAVHVLRSMMFLRIGPWTPLPQMTAICVLAGTVACAWADPRLHVFGPALSTWTRTLRQPAFWLRLTADPSDAIRLATGRG